MWFHSWSDLVRVIVVGAAAYATLVVILRLSGKRTLAKLSAFDLVVTVALGSTLAATLLNSTVSWAEGVAGLGALALFQLVAAKVSMRGPKERELLTGGPSLLVKDGEVLQEQLHAQRVTRNEVLQAVRATGSGDLSDVAAVVLETDGTLSVISRDRLGRGSALVDVPEF